MIEKMVIDKPVYQIYYRDFPLAFRFGSYLALFRSMAIAHLVEQLYDTSRLTQQTYHRLQTTRTLIKQLIQFGTDSDEGMKVLEHMNRAHSTVIADNDAYRYVLCCFFLEPFRWNACFGSRQMSDEQKQTAIDFWCEIGRRMGIQNLLVNEREWLHFQADYENIFLVRSEKGHLLAQRSLVETPKLVFPLGVRNLIRQSLLATMEDKVRLALGLKAAILPAPLLLALLKPVNRLAQSNND